MYKKIILTGSILAALSVILGAFAAHGLSNILDEKLQKTFETAVKYQMYHSIAIIICGILAKQFGIKTYTTAALVFFIGIVLFSGSLYTLVFVNVLTNSTYNFVGIITPFGGLAFIIGWILLGIASLKT